MTSWWARWSRALLRFWIASPEIVAMAIGVSLTLAM
jgi:hypothetical protein